ncbi:MULTISPECIES: UvrD-helicase domain-containing protein [unclassified Pseudomonas]|uniref:UvrD-helicase domain-containing protein n=1 Tax=unclassified Pseudomonas TaxID=196821 RepID=UPI0014825ECC|nr:MULTISPECIES: UvrD-helicase domain-containing protein [unclassified Pseudomonas]
MNPFDRARRKAIEIRGQLLSHCQEGIPDSDELLANLEDVVEIAIEPVPHDHFELGNGDAVLKRSIKTIYIRNDASPEEYAYLLAHELGHWFLDFVEGKKTISQLSMLNPQVEPGEAIIVEGYGAWERQELQANVFARELLLPRELAFELWQEGGRSRSIAKRLHLHLELVRQQLADALLLPRIPIPPAPIAPTPSKAQLDAAEAKERFVNVVAGPGTGKTTTLVHRITYLLNQGVPPNKILVLTFTTRAAHELVERLRIANVTGASQIWAGTFHALGLEFLRKYHTLFDLTPQIRIADDLQQVKMMVQELPKIELQYYRRLQNPYDWLPEVLGIISRLKEELVTPDDYANILAKLPPMDDETTRNRKDIELIYRAYEDALQREKWVDYTDLLVRLTRQAESNRPAIAQFVDLFEHVLVDEYQDVTHVMVELVKLLGSSTKNLWVVGDIRQAIHHWRGASIQSLLKFEQAFVSGTSASIRRYSLDVNRRSTPEILRVVDLAGRLHALQPRIAADVVTPNRPPSGQIPARYQCEDSDSQTLTVAQQILSAVSNQHPFRNQCIISATNAQLDELADGLARVGIPTLHIGDVLQRPSIQRFLCLMQLLSHKCPTALWGLRSDPLLGMPEADIAHLIAISKADKQWHKGGWAGKNVPGLSPAGIQANEHLGHLFKSLKAHKRPWDFVCELILELGFGMPSLDDDTTPRQIERLALWLFLYGVRNGDGSASQATLSKFLEREDMRRRIKQRIDRTIPPEASAINAVRLMTIHGSKGLEFPVVHFPNVDNARFGSRGGHNGENDNGALLLPPEVLNSNAEERAFEANVEQNNLLYVALSRAKDCLNIYCTKVDIPACIRDGNTVQTLNGVAGVPTKKAKPAKAVKPATTPTYSFAAIETLIGCPKQFNYSHELELPREQEIDVSMRARSALLDALERVFRDGAPATDTFNQVWEERALPAESTDQNLVAEAFGAFNIGLGIQAATKARYVPPQKALVEGVQIEMPWMLEAANGNLHWLHTGMSLKYLSSHVRPLMLNLVDKPQHVMHLHSLSSGNHAECLPSDRPGNTSLVKAVKALGKPERGPIKKSCNRCAYRAICTS